MAVIKDQVAHFLNAAADAGIAITKSEIPEAFRASEACVMPHPNPPVGTRLIIATENLLDLVGTRTEDGRALWFAWGEPDEHGWYSPTFTAVDDGMRLVPAAEIDRLWAALDEIRRIADPGVGSDAPTDKPDKRGRRLKLIFQAARAALSDPAVA